MFFRIDTDDEVRRSIRIHVLQIITHRKQYIQTYTHDTSVFTTQHYLR